MARGSFGVMVEKAVAVLKKDFLTAIRYRNGFLLGVISPAAQLASFYYLSRAIGPQFRPEGMPYLMFLVAGTGFYSLLISGIYSFLHSVQESQQTGTLEVLMTTSTSPTGLLVLNSISAFAGNLVQFGVYIGSGMLLFSSAVKISFLGGAAVLVFSLVIAVAIGLFAAGLQIAIHKGSAVVWAMGSVAWLITGVLFPIAVLPRPLRLVAEMFPFTHSLAGMRMALSLPVPGVLTREVEVLALFSGLLLPLGIFFFSWTVRRARQMGSLSFY